MKQTILFLALSLLINTAASGQRPFYDDAQARLYLKFDKSIVKNLDLQLVLQNRLSNNFMMYERFGINPELSFKLSKNFKLLLGYSYIQRKDDEGLFLSRHQVYGGFIAKVKFDQWSILYRNIVAVRNRVHFDPVKAATIRVLDRNKLTVKYEINKRFEVYVAGEAFTVLHDLPYLYMNRVRGGFGVAYNLTRRSYIEGYFMFQRRYNNDFYQQRDFIYGLTYSYDFK